MSTCKYVSSNGTEFNLYTDSFRVTKGTFHSRKWTPNVTSLRYGELIKYWSKDAIEISLTAEIRGNQASRNALKNQLSSAFDLDIRNESPGKLFFGDYSIECYCSESETTTGELAARTSLELNFYCPYPFWVSETALEPFRPTESASETGLDYPYDYPYDYANVRESVQTIKNESPFASAFRMTIWGPATNPSILIADHTYRINGSIASGERIEIDSKNKTIYHYSASGVKTNWFGKRYKVESIFEPIPAGVSTLSWSGSFGFSMTLLDERSEPPWEV